MIVESSFRLALLASLSLALAACSGTTAADGGPSQANPLDDEENDAIQQLNLLRMKAGVTPVTVCPSLDVSAAAHSDDMRDKNYLSEKSPPPTSSDVRTRACAAGYTASCGTTIPMGELVAEGYGTGAQTITQWDGDSTSMPILLQSDLLYAGIGRSYAASQVWWTLDLASVADPSCQ